MSVRERTITALHRIYKYAVSPALHAGAGATGACRFQPTCSEYAVIAVSEFGLLRGGLLAAWRLLRCQPFAKGGFDPVPLNPRRHRRDAPALGPHTLR